MDFSRYTKFFNYGYFLSKFEPNFLKKLLSATEGEDEINEPLKAGQSQYEKEQVIAKLRKTSRSLKKGKDKEKGIEPEL